MSEGIIIKGTKREFTVRTETGEEFLVTPRKTLITNQGPLFVGDYVTLDEENKTIVSFKKRLNRLIRPRLANVFYGAIVASTAEPKFSSYLLDKYLTYLLFSHVTPIILFTKTDKLSKDEYDMICEYRKYYDSLGIKSYLTSVKKPDTYREFIEEIKGKTVIFLGQTGAGKSSSINIVDPDLNRAIGEYSKALGRGKHQTKEVVLFPFNGGYIGDTPGFSSLELPMNEEEVAANFPGFSTTAHECYFSDCLHINEKKCTILERLHRGELSQESYDNYLKILEEVKGEKKI